MGIIDSQNVQVTPSSLYLEQLRERLGDQALSNIGYGSTDQGIGNPGSASAVTVTGNRR